MITATAGPPGMCSSSLKARPDTGRGPTTSKKSSETRNTVAVPPVPRVPTSYVADLHAETASNVEVCPRRYSNLNGDIAGVAGLLSSQFQPTRSTRSGDG